jgi:hypothetical protein
MNGWFMMVLMHYVRFISNAISLNYTIIIK